MSQNTVNVVLASDSKHKIESVKRGVASLHKGCNVVVQTKKVPSGINEQPVGLDETLKGAINRLEGARAIVSTESSRVKSFDYIVAIENGVYSVSSPAGILQWFDIGWVVVENKLGERHTAACPAIQVPTRMVEYARNTNFTKTVGHALQEELPHADPNDPHSAWTNGAISRTDLLVSGVIAAMAQFAKPKL